MWPLRAVLLSVGGTIYLFFQVSNIPFLSPKTQVIFSCLPTLHQHHPPCQFLPFYIFPQIGVVLSRAHSARSKHTLNISRGLKVLIFQCHSLRFNLLQMCRKWGGCWEGTTSVWGGDNQFFHFSSFFPNRTFLLNSTFRFVTLPVSPTEN